jgi:ABC-type arginine/histidine transport system permease subunit
MRSFELGLDMVIPFLLDGEWFCMNACGYEELIFAFHGMFASYPSGKRRQATKIGLQNSAFFRTYP